MNYQSMFSKISDYLYLVLLNKFFLIGLILGYFVKAVYGGIFISLVTGAAAGILIHEIIKLLAWG